MTSSGKAVIAVVAIGHLQQDRQHVRVKEKKESADRLSQNH